MVQKFSCHLGSSLPSCADSVNLGGFTLVNAGQGVMLTTQPPSKCRGHGRVELYLSSPSRPSWPVIGRTFTVTFNADFERRRHLSVRCTSAANWHITGTSFLLKALKN